MGTLSVPLMPQRQCGGRTATRQPGGDSVVACGGTLDVPSGALAVSFKAPLGRIIGAALGVLVGAKLDVSV